MLAAPLQDFATGILPGTNGSARVCFSDGTEAIVGVKAEIQKTADLTASHLPASAAPRGEQSRADDSEGLAPEPAASNEWLEITVEIPGFRDDDATTVFLASMLSEALTADPAFAKKLVINRRFHWKLYLDSEGDEDPMFDDDWEAATYLYPPGPASKLSSRPPITLLVIAIGDNIFFDPSGEELAVAEVALAVSVAEYPTAPSATGNTMDLDSARSFALVSVRTIDPPSRLTPPGIPDAENPATGATGATSGGKEPQQRKAQSTRGVWRAPVGGAKFSTIQLMIQQVMEREGWRTRYSMG
ncbi:unnamed protein product [Parascedosporium putredinis]|uniref:Ribosomal RNA-processing protein 42 n=1 Tax=Parascedosporium putredinis TaxID=1442378 RepID=A0A9P1H5N8_9PEZI|nr:unnamed protein product [Parascedosporium putredinis]CAI7999508.1 unnamed protein product [Parascedosporium putredinis]